ncbi:hypothetical protein BJ912DRAFT_1056868 [Pholiota molesta]|nr:hypothetical protein BJ912DRAFT_1056868 [Pholiota molesta]
MDSTHDDGQRGQAARATTTDITQRRAARATAIYHQTVCAYNGVAIFCILCGPSLAQACTQGSASPSSSSR